MKTLQLRDTSSGFSSGRRVSYHGQTARTLVDSVECGVLFVMAFWSGPAQLAYARLQEALRRQDPAGRIEVLVADIDQENDLYEAPFFQMNRLTGCGETAWICRGAVVAAIGHQPDRFEQCVQSLLKCCASPP